MITCMLFTHASLSSDVSWLAAGYVDTLNKVNIKGGIVLNDSYEPDEERPYYFGAFKYADLEIGAEGEKLTVGVGHHIAHGLDRIGLSYAKLETQDLTGIEAVISQMGMSLKLGYYHGLNDTDNKWLLGLGFGF